MKKIFVGLVVMTMVTILMARPLMKYYLELQLKDEKKTGAGSDDGVSSIVMNSATNSLLSE